MRPKILCILHLPPPVHGAAMVGSFIKNSSLINSKFDVDYINLSTSTNLIDIGKGGINKILLLFKIQFQVCRALLFKNYQICYLTLTASGPGYYKDVLVVALLKLFGKKIIYHFHNKGVAEYQKSKINRLIYKFTFNGTQSILLSPFLYSDLEQFVKPNDVSYCPNGIPEIRINKISLSKPSTVRLLFLSNMMAEKGVFVLLEACQILKNRDIKFECNFVGSWSDISEAQFNQELLNYGLSNLVFAHGKKFGTDKNIFFEDADIFIFPTYYHNETFGLVNLEAMQFSLPIISTPEGGIPDVVVDGETGYLVPQRDAIALADKIEYLIKNPELRVKMGAAGRKRYEELFTLEKFEKNMVEILTAAINKK